MRPTPTSIRDGVLRFVPCLSLAVFTLGFAATFARADQNGTGPQSSPTNSSKAEPAPIKPAITVAATKTPPSEALGAKESLKGAPAKQTGSQPAVATAIELKVLPGDFTLWGINARQRLLAQRLKGDLDVGEVQSNDNAPAGVTWTSSKPAVVRVEGNFAYPVANGTAQLTATATLDGQTQTAQANVTVQGMDDPQVWSFRNHVQSVLTKTGCNSGPCHGAQHGKKGFKLSLRGYDAEGDFDTLTRQARGRRVLLSDPGRSLLLTKGTSVIPHGGGERFSPDSLEYQVLSSWIANGAPPPKKDDAQIVRLDIFPKKTVLAPEESQQYLVTAYFSDGRSEDVTHWAKYTSSNAEVAQIDENGLLKVVGNGEGAISALYLNQLVKASVTVPFGTSDNHYVYGDEQKRNFIDEMILAKLKDLNLPPSPVCNDREFIRRAFIDTIGTLPTAEETNAFVADTRRDKRDRLIDELLHRPEFVDYWTMRISDLLLVNSEKLEKPAMWAYSNWIRGHIEQNTPWDEMVKGLVTASGSTLENGAANFFVLHKESLDLTETISMAFMGMSINCARCHNHPLEKWTNDQYFGMANMVARVRLKNGPGKGNFIVYSATEGDLIQPLTGVPQEPRPLDAEGVDIHAPIDRRIALAEWLTSPQNAHFSRSITNRIWANFMGVGLVEKVDDVRFTNPASNEALFGALADHLVEKKFDLRELIRTILQSTTYQRSSTPLAENAADQRFYSHYYPKRMHAEVVIDAVSQVTAVPTTFAGYPEGWRAIQLPDSKVPSYFLDSFGRPDRQVTSEEERTTAMGMVQVLHLSNGDTLNKKLLAKGNRLDQLVATKKPMGEMIDTIYLEALSRPPTKAEREALLQVYESSGKQEPRPFLEDLYWGILSSKEFLFNH